MFKDTTVDDLRTILQGTVVIYKDEVVLVKEIVDPTIITIYHYESKKHIQVEVDSPNFNYNPFHLGFVNTNKGVYYITRAPLRQYRQGLCHENMQIKVVQGIDPVEGNEWANNFRSLRDGKALNILYKGIYPSLEEAKNMLDKQEDVKIRAVARAFAIDNAGRLIYKTDIVGMLDWATDKAVFFRDKQHLEWLWERRNESV